MTGVKRMDLLGSSRPTEKASSFDGTNPRVITRGHWIVSPVSYEDYCAAVVTAAVQLYEVTLAVLTFGSLPEYFSNLSDAERSLLDGYKMLPRLIHEEWLGVYDKFRIPADFYVCFNPDAKYPYSRWNTLMFLQAFGFGGEYPQVGSNTDSVRKDIVTMGCLRRLLIVSREILPKIFYSRSCSMATGGLAVAMRSEEFTFRAYSLDSYLSKPFEYLRPVTGDKDLPVKIIKCLSQDVRLLPGYYCDKQLGCFTVDEDGKVEDHDYTHCMWDC